MGKSRGRLKFIRQEGVESVSDEVVMMDYSKFKINSVIDWVEVKIILKGATNHQTIRRHLPLAERGVYIHPVDATSENGTSNTFSVRKQEPESAESFSKLMQVLQEKFPFSEEPVITGVEISVDARSKAKSIDELKEMAEIFLKFNKRPNKWRICGPKGTRGEVSFVGNIGSRATREAVGRGLGLNAGNRGDTVAMRIYVKSTDNSGKTILDIKDQRARIEVTLSGVDLPFQTLEEWGRYSFEKLAQPYFSFLKLKPNLTPLEKIITGHDVRTRLAWNESIPEMQNRLRTRRVKSKVMSADIELNKRIRDALRKLSSRQQKMTKRGGSIPTPAVKIAEIDAHVLR